MITLTLSELAYVASAVDTGLWEKYSRVALSNHEGHVYLCATDTHRLHTLRLGAAIEGVPDCKSLKALTLDHKTLLALLKAQKGTSIELGDDLKITMYAKERSLGIAPVDFEESQYCNWARVVPDPIPANQYFAINPKYLKEATALATDQGIVVQQAAKDRAIVYRPNNSDARWSSVVMPIMLKLSDLELETVL